MSRGVSPHTLHAQSTHRAPLARFCTAENGASDLADAVEFVRFLNNTKGLDSYFSADNLDVCHVVPL